MSALIRSFIGSVRRLGQSPLSSAFAVLTLALSIGATTAVFAVVQSVVFRVPVIDEVNRVVKLYHSAGGDGPSTAFSLPDFADLRSRQTSFSAVSSWTRLTSSVLLPGGARPIIGEFVDGQYFRVLRTSPMLGRLIDEVDNAAGAPPVVVLGAQFWETHFGATSNVIGEVLEIGGHDFTVIGVAAWSARGMDMPNLAPAAVWLPIGHRERLLAPASLGLHVDDRDNRWVRGLARLADGQSLDRANEELQQIGRVLDAAAPIGRGLRPEFRTPSSVSRQWQARPVATVLVHESVEPLVVPIVTVVFATLLLVLMVAYTNLANLLLAGALKRRHESAVRLALGASRARVAYEYGLEIGALIVTGGLLGVLVARGLLVMMAADIPVGDIVPVLVSLRPELTRESLLMALAATLVSFVVAGVTPVLSATAGNVWTALSAEGAAGHSARWGRRRWLIGTQVMACAAILILAAVAAGRARELGRQDFGLDIDSVAFVSTNPGIMSIPASRAIAVLTTVAEQARQWPRVSAAAVTTALPVGSGGALVLVPSLADTNRVLALRAIEASAGVLTVTGWPLLSGRDVVQDDVAQGRRVAVISERAAHQIFGSSDVLGRTFRFRRTASSSGTAPLEDVTVVGVASDVRDGGPMGQERPVMVIPLGESTPNDQLSLVARSSAPDDTALLLRSALLDVEPAVTVTAVGTGASLTGGLTLVLRVVAATAGLLGAFALVLALIGIYGVLLTVVSQRRREIGIRLAIGAQRAGIRRMVMFDGLVPVLWGVFAGGLVSSPVLLSPVGQSVLQVHPGALVYALVALVAIVGAGAAAVWVPALTASSVEPNVVLRES